MGMHGLIRGLSRARSLQRALDACEGDADLSIPEGLRAPLLAAMLERRGAQAGGGQALLLVAPTSREADAVRAALADLLPSAEILELPAWETLPHERLSPTAGTVGARLGAMRRLATWRARPQAERPPLIMVAGVRAALQPVAAHLDRLPVIELSRGTRGYALDELATRLVELGYERVDLVTRRGDFALRGGILDVFGPESDHPVRADFFGDELDDLRAFSVADQRSFPEESPALVLGAVAEPPGRVPLTDYFPPDAVIALVSPERIASRAVSLAETDHEFAAVAWEVAALGGEAPASSDSGGFLTVTQLHEAAAPRSWWTISPTGFGIDADTVVVDAEAMPAFAGHVEGALDYVAELVGDSWSVVVAAAGTGTVERIGQLMAERGIPVETVEELPAVRASSGTAWVTRGSPEGGFRLPAEKIAVLTEAEFLGRSAGVDARAPKRLAARRQNVVDPLQLAPGDLVVHATHGIGRFIELVQREVSSGERQARGPLGSRPAKVTREYLVLEYAPSKRGQAGDRLSVPTDQLDQLSRYVGGEDPPLSKMGGSDWSAAKGKARKAVREIAVELVKLYSARMSAPGHAFGPDTPWQRELEEAFPYAETPDQLQTIDEVKADMEKAVPMDRLISGDVGFGKTEIAVRAAFKAIQDGHQVAVLVPTTLLVRQHLDTFASRYAGFPITLRGLSRFQTEKESKEIIAGLADGSVDVVIGTHRLLAESVRFKKLGLVVIDEEQRFGVEHKDRLKQMKTNVDVLAMSATPIPRSLEMAVTGIRELSTLATAPEDRHPILSSVGPYSEQLITAAINRELLREGQVFYVHNRVADIDKVAARIAELVPEARVAVAHGKLGEAALEQVVGDFWERRADVLVTTTIIEAGIDIANANTLIVDRADRFGLSQLHQLRGRVGRGRERGYAYFLYDGDTPLSETAQDRLETLAKHGELGSGMQIALKDLEIRGAGNLLGGEQSGHIAGVGFDLYLRMIGEAVAEFRHGETPERTELRLELPVDARIPEEYIDSERLRLEAYRKLSIAAEAESSEDAVDRVIEEFTDRYGELPDAVENLVAITRLRRRAQLASLSDVVAMGGRLRLAPAELPDSIQVRLTRMYPGSTYITAQKVALVPLPEDLDGSALIAWTGELFTAIFPVR